ncbi:bombesin receptor subtype-3-like [Antedon mediterranea]|uniref:bombesin receptor subtype-3-like n=1 Tax=Antedon mediterranea TaxID=105859 RepID=UPI003AF8E03E
MSNQSSNTTLESDITDGSEDWAESCQIYLWAAICLTCVGVGVIGNLTLIYIILRNDTMRNTRNMLICNIAVGDLLLLVSYPTYTLSFVFDSMTISWTDILCKFFKTWLLISQGVSVLSLTWLSVERYQAFSTTQRGFVSRYVMAITLGIWIVAIIFTLPLIIYTNASEGNIRCLDFPVQELSGRLYGLFQFAALYVIPLFIILIHYCLIIGILFKSVRRMPIQTSNRDDQIRRRKRSSLVLFLITVMFAMCWLPHFIRSMITHFDDDYINLTFIKFKLFSEMMIYVSGCINPVTLFLISKRHRHYYKKYLCCTSQRSRQLRVGFLSSARSIFSTRQTQADLHMRTVDLTYGEKDSESTCLKQNEAVYKDNLGGEKKE